MHGAENDTVFNGSQEFFVGFQKRTKTVKVGRRYLEGPCIRSVSPACDTVACLAMSHIDTFAPCDIGRVFLRLKERREQENGEPDTQGGYHARGKNTHHISSPVAPAIDHKIYVMQDAQKGGL